MSTATPKRQKVQQGEEEEEKFESLRSEKRLKTGFDHGDVPTSGSSTDKEDDNVTGTADQAAPAALAQAALAPAAADPVAAAALAAAALAAAGLAAEAPPAPVRGKGDFWDVTVPVEVFRRLDFYMRGAVQVHSIMHMALEGFQGFKNVSGCDLQTQVFNYICQRQFIHCAACWKVEVDHKKGFKRACCAGCFCWKSFCGSVKKCVADGKDVHTVDMGWHPYVRAALESCVSCRTKGAVAAAGAFELYVKEVSDHRCGAAVYKKHTFKIPGPLFDMGTWQKMCTEPRAWLDMVIAGGAGVRAGAGGAGAGAGACANRT